MPGTDPVPVEFSGVSTNRIVCGKGDASSQGATSMAAVIRPAASEGTFRAIYDIETVTNSVDLAMLLNNDQDLYIQYNSAAVTSTALGNSSWYMVTATHAGGTATARLGYYSFASPGWTRETSGSVAAITGTDDHIAIGTFNDTSHPFEGFMATMAHWNRVLSDADFDAMTSDLDAWEAEAPDWWVIANGATPMVDETGGTGDETSRGVGVTSGAAQTSPLQWLPTTGPQPRGFMTSRGVSW